MKEKTYFENNYIRDNVFYDEYLGYVFFRKPILLVANSLLLLAFVVGLLTYWFPEIFLFESIKLFLVLFPLFIWTTIVLRYFKARKNYVKQDFELNNGKFGYSCLIITEKSIKTYGMDNEMKYEIELKQIKKVIKTNSFDILVTKANLALPFKKDGYKTGTKKEFESFLNERGIKY